MKVLFIKDVGGVGRHGEIKEVADGYAMNHLIPNGFAVQATADKIKAHAEAVQKDHAAREQEQQVLTANIQSLESARVEIAVRATEKGGLFKSLNATDIQKAVKVQKQIDIPIDIIQLEKPIKEIGEHQVEIKTAGAKAGLIFVVKKAD
jgi:large subunit ribosomal protein L9